ncbi:WD40 repeat domain-containing protein [Granulosicoccus sp. 3-233]|uniref:WD40 repeat domain-containing protein n=1 Tax=Granulosicoccus sp. 3-233 TaxID=3417969 RepID=UPI003D34AF26
MAGNRSPGTSLFELLARAWTLGEDVAQTAFNQSGTAVIYRLHSGRLALASNKDSESPRSRTRIEADTGRTTIRPRKNPVPEARTLPVKANPALPVVRFTEQGFLAVDINGTAHRVTAQGQCIEQALQTVGAICSLCSSLSGDLLAIAGTSAISIYRTSNMEVLAEIDLDRHISCMAFSNTGNWLAAWGEDTLALIDVNNSSVPMRQITGIDSATQITWDKSDSHLACTASKHAFWIVDVDTGNVQQVDGYPGEVRVAAFNDAAGALVTSGAFRVAGWSTDDLPHDDQPGTPLSTGKPGMVVINTVASHPLRSLVAVGYPDGLVTITSIGSTQEMMVHKEAGTAVSQLAWSDTGEHLSIGFQSGKAAVVTFPDKLFK